MAAIAIALSLLLAVFPQTSPQPAPTLPVWPKPRRISWLSPSSSPLSPNFTISSPNHPYLTPAVRRYHRQILTESYRPLLPPATAPSASPLERLTVTVADTAALLHHGVDESYNLTVPASGGSADLAAGTVWGAMRGLETLSQLAWGTPPRVAAGVQIQDWPMFGHRGLLLDTARNFYPVRDVLRTIRGMSMNKMNVFHWHITDSQSFSVVLPSEPALGEKGSYGGNMRYTAADVRRIVEFGLEHGVRVLPEIDTPGHAGSWAEAYPDIVTCAKEFWWPAGTDWSDRLASEPGTGQLDPLNDKTYRVLKNVFRDVAALFPEPFFHGGSDEVAPGCWKSQPEIRAFLSNGGTLRQLLEIFVNSTLPFIASLNRTAVYWEDVLLDEHVSVDAATLPRERVVLQTWNGGRSNTKKIVGLGYRVIVSSSDFYYLDCGHGSFVGNDSQYEMKETEDSEGGDGGSWCGPFKTWQTIYNYEIAEGLSAEEARLVLGGEVALWSEQADWTVVDGRIWPRACAMGEALWSGNRDGTTGTKRYAEATDRLNEWRNRMVCRGFAAEPIQPLWCIRNPGMCNTVQSA